MKPAGFWRGLSPLIAILVCALFATRTRVAAQSVPGKNEASGISKPSQEVKLSFSTPGVVRDAPVKEGDAVKAGQIVLSQEDVIDKKELERLLLEANSTARVEAAEADLGVKQAKLKRVKQIYVAGAGNEAELEEAENDVVLRDKQLLVAREEKQQAKIKAEQQSRKIELLQIKSTFDGIVERIVVHVGEWADPQSRDGTIVVVRNDPLYVEVRELATRQVARLEMGQKLMVRHADDPDKPENWQEAKIIFFSPVADAQANTRLVRMEMPNPKNRESGQWMIVKLPENVTAAAEGAASGVAGK